MAKKKTITTAKINNLIKKYLRNASLKSPYRQIVLQNAKVDASTHECSDCGCYVYSGVSDKNFAELKKKHIKKCFKRGKVEINHIDPVVDPKSGFVDWNTYIERLFVKDDKMNALCKECHSKLTEKQNKLRK